MRRSKQYWDAKEHDLKIRLLEANKCLHTVLKERDRVAKALRTLQSKKGQTKVADFSG